MPRQKELAVGHVFPHKPRPESEEVRRRGVIVIIDRKPRLAAEEFYPRDVVFGREAGDLVIFKVVFFYYLHRALDVLERVRRLVVNEDAPLVDPALHKQNTGVDNRLILENVEKLKQSGEELRFRMPYIPGYNDAEAPAVRAVTEGFPLELMAYHEIGVSKYAALGMDYPCKEVIPPKKEDIADLAASLGAIFDPAM